MSGNRNPLMPKDHHATLEEVVAHLSKPENRIGGAVDAEDNTNNSFTNLPKDIQVYLGGKLDLVSFFALSRTSKSHRVILKKSTEAKAMHDAVLDLLRRLLSHTALGEFEQAEIIWKKYPSLLTVRGTVYHPNRVYINGQDPVDLSDEVSLGRYQFANLTAWQIALINEEYEEAELMGQWMTEEEKRRQYAEIFPNEEMEYPQDLARAKVLLQNVFNAVIQDKSIDENNLAIMNDKTRTALKALRDDIKPKPAHQTGLLFDPVIYLAARQQYDHPFLFPNRDQRSFWCIRVEEMIASVLGTGYLRPHAQGIGRAAHRSGCLLPDGSSYFSFRRGLTSIAGAHFFVGNYRMAGPEGRDIQWGAETDSGRYKAYVKKKREKGRTYAAVFACKSGAVCNSLSK